MIQLGHDHHLDQKILTLTSGQFSVHPNALRVCMKCPLIWGLQQANAVGGPVSNKFFIGLFVFYLLSEPAGGRMWSFNVNFWQNLAKFNANHQPTCQPRKAALDPSRAGETTSLYKAANSKMHQIRCEMIRSQQFLVFTPRSKKTIFENFIRKRRSWHWNVVDTSSSTAHCGGRSFKNRKPIGEIGCCESRMTKQNHWLNVQVSNCLSDQLTNWRTVRVANWLIV